ncbi:PEGA domain-containing protein [bacterium]|nr:PEGA domain-containing protein [candidate division CSSED10-310 bacterium]
MRNWAIGAAVVAVMLASGCLTAVTGKVGGFVAVSDAAIVVLETTPGETEVFIDGTFVALTPVRVYVSSGSHELLLKKKGYETIKDSFTVVPAQEITIAHRLRLGESF